MNFNVTNVIMFMAGSLLVYSGIKGKLPKDVIMAAFDGKTVTPNKAPNKAPATSLLLSITCADTMITR